MPRDILDAVLALSGALELAAGAEPAPIHPHPTESYRLFPSDGSPQPDAEWRDRRTGQPMTDGQKAGLGAVTRWDPRRQSNVDPFGEHILSLPPAEMVTRIRTNLTSGRWCFDGGQAASRWACPGGTNPAA
jgi:hypothetical protein